MNLSWGNGTYTDRPAAKRLESEINARLWVLNLSDGEHSLLDIAERSGLPFSVISDAAEVLREGGLLAPVPDADIAELRRRKAAGNMPEVTPLR